MLTKKIKENCTGENTSTSKLFLRTAWFNPIEPESVQVDCSGKEGRMIRKVEFNTGSKEMWAKLEIFSVETTPRGLLLNILRHCLILANTCIFNHQCLDYLSAYRTNNSFFLQQGLGPLEPVHVGLGWDPSARIRTSLMIQPKKLWHTNTPPRTTF